jgi:hypothetical protein
MRCGEKRKWGMRLRLCLLLGVIGFIFGRWSVRDEIKNIRAYPRKEI